METQNSPAAITPGRVQMSAPTDVCECGHIHMDGFGVIRAACPAHGCNCDKFTARGLPPESQGEVPQPAEPCAQGAETAEVCPNCGGEIIEGAQLYQCDVCGKDCCTPCSDNAVVCDACLGSRNPQSAAAAAASAARIAELKAEKSNTARNLAHADEKIRELQNYIGLELRQKDARLAEVTRERDGAVERIQSQEAEWQDATGFFWGLAQDGGKERDQARSALAASETERERLRVMVREAFNDGCIASAKEHGITWGEVESLWQRSITSRALAALAKEGEA